MVMLQPQTNQSRLEPGSVVDSVERHLRKIIVAETISTASFRFTLAVDSSVVTIDDIMAPFAQVGFGPIMEDIPHNSIAVAGLPGGLDIGTWADIRESDPAGATLNNAQVVGTNGQPVLVADQQVFALAQVINSVVSGDFVAPAASPNTRLAFYTGSFQEVALPAGVYDFRFQQNLVDRMIPERVVFRVSGGGAVSTPTFVSAELHSVQRGEFVAGTTISVKPYPNNHLFSTQRGVFVAGTAISVKPYPNNHLFSTQRGVFAAGTETKPPVVLPYPSNHLFSTQRGEFLASTAVKTVIVGGLTTEQLSIVGGQPAILSLDATEVELLTLNGVIYWPDIVIPGRTGQFWTFTAPRTIRWNPSNDTNILSLSPFDSFVVRYRPAP